MGAPSNVAVARANRLASHLRDDALSDLYSLCQQSAAFTPTNLLRDAHVALLSAVSADAGLNELQHHAFALFGMSVLDRLAFERCRYRASDAPGESVPTVPPAACQLQLYGAGGTGKCCWWWLLLLRMLDVQL